MLHVPVQSSSPSPSPSIITVDRPPPRVMSGRKLGRILKGAGPRDRALVAFDLAHGTVQIAKPTYAQAARLAGASTSYVAAVSRLSGDERRALARGDITLRETRQDSVDARLDRLVARFGAEVLLRALDRATAPTQPVAAE